MNGLFSFLKKQKKTARILLVTHAGCDIDALASAAALQLAFAGKYKMQIAVPEHLNLSAKALAKNLQIKYEINANINNFDSLILLDLNSFKMLGAMEKSIRETKKPILLIDHHVKSADKITANAIIRPEAVASAEIVYDLLKENKAKITPKIAELIACGIITDSAGFMVADHETFSIMAETMKIANKPFSAIVSLFELEEDISEKIAKLKAAKRVRIYKIRDFIVTTTSVGCFEAEAASALVRLGADIAFAGDVEEGKLKISARAKHSFLRKTGFDLAKHVFEPLEKIVPGNGGGHAGAAGYNGVSENFDEAMQKCLSLVQEFAKTRFGSADTKEYD